MKNLIIDERIREEEINYLSKYFNVIKLEMSDSVYPEISGHSDIFYCKINDKIICSPNAKYKNDKFTKGYLNVENKYPKDVLYNVCQIGNFLISNKFVDKKILENFNGKIVTVNQGYVKCSIAVTGNNSCITSDVGIYKRLKEENIDVFLIKENNINLLDRNKNKSKMKGFIGGATFVFDDNFVLFGDFNNLSMDSKDIILKHLEKNKLNLVDFKGLEIVDYGSAIIFE